MHGTYRKRAPQLGVVLLAVVSVLVSVALHQPTRAGQSMIPSERRVTWQPGIPGGIPTYSVVANVRNYGAKGDGVTDDAAAFRSAIAAVPTSGGAVLIPAGRYLVKSTLQINKSVVLRGEGAGKTQLLFNAPGVGIEMTKSVRGAWVNLTGGYSKGSNSITVADASAFAPGKLAEIQQANDPALMYTSSSWNVDWAANAVGQIVKVVGVSGNTLTLAEPLNISFRASLSPQIRTNALLEYAGIEYLTLRRQDASEAHFVVMKNVAYTWMRGVHSQLARRTHLYINTGYRCELRQNYFDDATSWTGGGHGYGVELNLHTTGCLVEDNIFRHLRHSMMVHVGANGNVFGYNYSREAYQNQDPGEWTPPDISIHGHYTFSNLFEGNVVQEVGIADHWGPAGPWNTYFRNRVEAENIDVQDSSHKQNVVGNELVKGRVAILDGSSDLLIHGNRVGGSINWSASIADRALPASYYHGARPGFYGALDWPSLGADLPGGTIPAKQRYLAGSYVPDPSTGVTPTRTRTRTATSGGTLPTATRTRTATSGGTLPTATRTRTAASASTNPTSTAVATMGLKVQYRNADSSPADSHIRPHLQVVNGGTAGVALDELKLRYYYTKEGTSGEQFWCDWAQLGCGNITGSFGTGYLEVGFAAGAGILASGQSSGEIQTRFNKTDWSNYDESNDYSLGQSGLSYADHARVTIYRNGAHVWGVPPL